MSDLPVFFRGELQFRRYSDTSTQGQTVMFSLADREALEPFIGKEGKRFACILIELGDDEQPVKQQPKAKPEAPKGGPLAKLAGQWCQAEEFHHWLSRRAAVPWSLAWRDYPGSTSAQIAAIVVRQLCGVQSRAEIDAVPEAAEAFQELIRRPYMAAQGLTA